MTIADMLNAPTDIEFEGVVYKMRQPTLIEEATFQRWLESRAWDAGGRAVELSDERSRRLDKETADSIAAGEYEWGGELCVKALRTPVGMAKLVAIVLRDQGMTDERAKRFIDRQLKEIAAVLVSKVVTDPNALRATLAKLGLPEDYLSSPSATRPSAARRTSSPSGDSATTNSCSSSMSSEDRTAPPG